MQSETFPFWVPRSVTAGKFVIPSPLRARAVPAEVAPFRSGATLLVEALDFDAAGTHQPAWRDLVARALEPNLFNEPAAALTAAQHLAGTHRPRFVFVWERLGDQPRGVLLAVCPLRVPGRLEGRSLIHTWTHEQAPFATPLIDARGAIDAVDALMSFCTRRQGAAAGIVFHGVAQAGPTSALLERWARTAGRSIWMRAASASDSLRLGHGGDRAVLPSAAGADAASLAIMRRELEKSGGVSFASLRHPSDVRFGTEEFLTLDARSGHAAADKIIGRSDVTTFTRSLTRRLAAEGKCRIDRLAVDGRAVAMAIVFTEGERHFLWRAACDVAFEPSGLQGQLVLGMLRAYPNAPAPLLADARGPMDAPGISRVWPTEVPVVDVAVATGSANRAFANAVQRDVMWRRLRAAVRHLSAPRRAAAGRTWRRIAASQARA